MRLILLSFKELLTFYDMIDLQTLENVKGGFYGLTKAILKHNKKIQLIVVYVKNIF